jgi:alkanesulfonate monooxygenase SsuD/methylene tetrahydromethanopterin reductase-like flavin-dependent oxidoreductase (luciferase family)
LIGGYTPAAVRRVGRWGDGYISGGSADPEQTRQLYDIAEESWKEEGREGRPRFVGGIYYALGPDAADRGADYIRDYYSFFGPAVEEMALAIPSTPEAIEDLIQAFSRIGMDELVWWPTIAELDQVNRLAEVIS